MNDSQPRRQQAGFTLVELAVVLVIVALLISGMLLGITAQRAAAENADVQRQLDNIREALLGYAMANGRLPCPAPANVANTSINAGVAIDPPCMEALQYGVVPWATLGLPENDPWGRRFTYFASSTFTAAVPAGARASFSLDKLGNANIKASTGSSVNIASDLPAVVVSHGSKGAGAWQTDGSQVAGAANDELENANNTLTFISRSPGESFDDLVIWIAPSILMSKMVASGRLP